MTPSIRSLLKAFLIVCLLDCRADAADYFTAPNGKPSGDGSKTQPWDLATALAGTTSIKPGDTLWLRGGTYTGEFTSRLKGSKSAPITVRQAPNERATIDLPGPTHHQAPELFAAP